MVVNNDVESCMVMSFAAVFEVFITGKRNIEKLMRNFEKYMRNGNGYVENLIVFCWLF